jgi:hypothetical protein
MVQPTIDFSGTDVKRKNSDRRENTLLYIEQMMLAGPGTVGAFIQFTDDNGRHTTS